MKLIIECAEQTYSECKKISGLSETAYVIAHGVPYNDSGDLISREALKKDIMAYKTMPEIRKAICEVIDNAQAVDLWQMRQEATENALKKAREADRWIPVSERLPDKNGNYLVCLNNGGITTDIFDEEELFMGFWGYMTHWRPLPKAPESEENK